MNRLIISLALAAATLAGCASHPSHRKSDVTIMDWTGKAEWDGQGGTVEKLEEIDIYRYGTPPGKFRVLGIIQTEYTRTGQERNTRREAKAAAEVLEAVRQKGGDAVVIVDENAKVVELASAGHSIPIGRVWINGGKTKLKEQVEIRALIVKYVR
jgi:hypothetical protein